MSIRNEIYTVLHQTWCTIGDDFYQSYEDSGIGHVTAEGIADILVDCDYLETYGGNPEVVREFRTLSFEEMFQIALEFAKDYV